MIVELTSIDYAVIGLVVVSLSAAAVAAFHNWKEYRRWKALARSSAYDVSAVAKATLLRRRDNNAARTLLVLTHGWRGSNLRWWRFLALAGNDPAFADCDVRLNTFSRWYWQRASLTEYAGALLSIIDLYAEHYHQIILVGYSAGGLITRDAYVAGLRRDAGWIDKVSRIVLLATPNRGFGGPNTGFSHRATAAMVRMLCRGAITDTLNGSDFITRLRLDWVKEFGDASVKTPTVVQLLGVDDAYVRKGDSKDVTSFDDGKLSMVPNSGHRSILQFDGMNDDRYALLRRACLDHIAQIKEEEEEPLPVNFPSSIVFQLHGIRDYGGWLEEFEREVKGLSPEARVIKPTYGYFSALAFLLPWVRNQRIAWFCDSYTDELALVAATARARGVEMDVPFYFIGHSYGTYLLAHALARFERMRFARVCLVGSVVAQEYDWKARFGSKQVRRVRNYCQSHDWPVAVLCQLLRAVLRNKDVGIGGFRGFSAGVPEIVQHKWVEGNHGGSLRDPVQLTGMAKFLVNGTEDKVAVISAPPRWLSFLSQWASFIFVGTAFVVIGAVYYFGLPYWVPLLLLSLVLLLLSKV